MSTKSEPIPIQHLKKGEKGRITSLIGQLDEVARLSALGVRTGVEVCGVQKGYPCIFRFGCSRMCLRTAGQLDVLVSRVPS
jgi:Fe2+ transport system protein FeoA